MNYNENNLTSKLHVYDGLGGTPITIEEPNPTNSLYIDSNGRAYSSDIEPWTSNFFTYKPVFLKKTNRNGANKE